MPAINAANFTKTENLPTKTEKFFDLFDQKWANYDLTEVTGPISFNNLKLLIAELDNQFYDGCDQYSLKIEPDYTTGLTGNVYAYLKLTP